MALSKNAIKFIQALNLKKYRQKYNKFIVEGEKMVLELLNRDVFSIYQLYGLPDWIEAHHQKLTIIQERLVEVDISELKKISALSTPNKVLAIVELPEAPIHYESIGSGLSLYLDNIQDPGNMGTLLRLADWFGIKHVLCSPDCVDRYNPKVIQASMGAIFYIAHPAIALEELVQQLPELPVWGTFLDGENIFQLEAPTRGIIVLGNEGNGISAQNHPFIQHKLTIPAAPGHQSESLNVAVAAGILCAWLRSG
ncbi:MAG TPA: RNA methyltransferase [Saprospiraceae bacterium]|nr:RNA methyltransferase [Saprospiraceae bacterium]HMQ83369.1 RNA methyltransferase [Saprospiraceae bacterium]